MKMEGMKTAKHIVKVLLAFLFLFGIVVVPVHACTNVSGTIASAIWTKANSPYCVEGDILAASLEIEPGVTIEFQGDYIFEVAGVLTAIGTEQEQITFTKAETNDVGWQGIFLNYSSPSTELKYCIIEQSINGGMYIDNSGPTISYCTIRDNSLSGEDQKGGGVFTNVPLTLDNCTISNNSISGSSGDDIINKGGGIYAESSLILNNCTISSNSSSASVSGTFDTARSYGGGIFANGDLELNNCLVFGNAISTSSGSRETACYSSGGGVYTNATGILKNCTLSYNLATASCSGINAFYYNYINGGGVYCFLSDTSLTNVEVVNSILWENSEDQISGDVTVTYSDVQDSFEGEGNINLNPVFQSDTDLTIVSGSPCIDTGNPDAQYNDVCFPPSLGTERNDMGAHGGPGACLFLESGCTYSISSTSGSFGSSGDTDSVGVTAGTDCNWTAVSNDTWITIYSGSNGTGDGTVNYSVSEYTDTTSRTGTMTIVGKTFTVTQYPFSVVDGLVAYYPFNGNANDESGNGNDGTVNGATLTEDRFSNLDSAYNFDGSSKIDSPLKPTNVFSLSLWYNAKSVQLENCGIVSTFSVSSWNGFYFAYRYSDLQRLWYDGNANVDISPDWNKWTHLVIVSDGVKIRVYKDGIVMKETNGTTTHATTMVIGDSRFNGRYFTGKIDDIRIYNRALLESEIQELYQGNTSCASISPTNESFYSSGVTGSVSVTAESDCDWTATSNDPDWITIQSGSSASGDGTVTYFVSENPYTTLRTGAMTIAGTIFTVSQEGTGRYRQYR